MAIADGGRETLAYIAEVTPGTTPASALTKIAFATQESLAMETSTTVSNAIRGDYIKPQVVRTQTSTSGGFNFEMAYADGPMLAFLPGTMRSSWQSAAATAATTLNAVDSGNTFTRAAGSFVTDGWVVGASGLSSGFTTAANNGYFVVTAVAALTLTVSGIDLADESGGGDEALTQSGYVKLGTTRTSYTLEKLFGDLTNTYIPFRGQYPSTFSISAQTGQIVTGSVGFMGMSAGAVSTATAGSGAYSASAGAGNEIMNGIDHVTGIYEADAGSFTTAVTYYVSQIDLTVSGPGRIQTALGNVAPVGIGGNSFEVTGSMRVWFDDNSKGLWDDYVAYTQKALWYRMVDTAGNAYLFYLPQIQFTGTDGPASGGPDSDVPLTVNFTAEYETNSASLLTVSRIAA